MVHTGYAAGRYLVCLYALNPSLAAVGGVVYLFVVQYITGNGVTKCNGVAPVNSHILVGYCILYGSIRIGVSTIHSTILLGVVQ